MCNSTCNIFPMLTLSLTPAPPALSLSLSLSFFVCLPSSFSPYVPFQHGTFSGSMYLDSKPCVKTSSSTIHITLFHPSEFQGVLWRPYLGSISLPLVESSILATTLLQELHAWSAILLHPTTVAKDTGMML